MRSSCPRRDSSQCQLCYFPLQVPLVPSQAGSAEDDISKPPTVSPALGSAGPLQITAESSPPAGGLYDRMQFWKIDGS